MQKWWHHHSSMQQLLLLSSCFFFFYVFDFPSLSLAKRIVAWASSTVCFIACSFFWALWLWWSSIFSHKYTIRVHGGEWLITWSYCSAAAAYMAYTLNKEGLPPSLSLLLLLCRYNTSQRPFAWSLTRCLKTLMRESTLKLWSSLAAAAAPFFMRNAYNTITHAHRLENGHGVDGLAKKGLRHHRRFFLLLRLFLSYTTRPFCRSFAWV